MRETTTFPMKASLEVHNTTIQPKITLIPESNHKSDHKNNTQELTQMINDGQIDGSTVICLERKKYGANFGMQDVRLLANLIEHNQKNPKAVIAIPEKIQNSLIYQDALLYNVAKAHGVEVIGIEGKGLSHSKESTKYNSVRETHMVERIKQISSTGKNVIFPVGAAHIPRLKEKLPSARVQQNINTATKAERIKNTLERSTEAKSDFMPSKTNSITRARSHTI